MTSYSTPLQVDQKKGFFEKIASGAESFNRKISPILQAGSNIIQTGRLALGLGGVGLDSASAMYEYGRSLTARKSDATLHAYSQDVYKDPQLLSSDLIDKATPHLNSLESFIDNYQDGRRVVSDRAFTNLSSRHAGYKELFNPLNANKNISMLTEQNKQATYAEAQRQLQLMSSRGSGDIISAIDTALNVGRAPTFIEDIRQTFNRMALDKYITLGDSADVLLDTYMTNINKNTIAGTRNAINAVKTLSKLVEKTGDGRGIVALRKLKYDLAVRLKRWEM